VWRNRSEFLTGRDAVIQFLRAKWDREHDYALRKSLWAYTDDRIAVRFQYEWHDDDGQWWRSYGNENWEFDASGYMTRREASINDIAIEADQRRIRGLGDLTSPPTFLWSEQAEVARRGVHQPGQLHDRALGRRGRGAGEDVRRAVRAGLRA
jgi:hypothetical protein